MLADWYFCCCIGSPSRRTAAFLAILETLQDPAAGDELVALTYEQLGRCEIWERAYAVPAVLRTQRRRRTSRPAAAAQEGAPGGSVEPPATTAAGFDVAQLAARYWEDLITLAADGEPDRARHLARLLASAAGRQSATATLQAARQCAQGLEPLTHLPSLTPYLDLQLFLPQLLLSALLADRAVDDPAFAAALATEAQDDAGADGGGGDDDGDDDKGRDSPDAAHADARGESAASAAPTPTTGLSLGKFLEQAGAGRYGRLCKRLAARTHAAMLAPGAGARPVGGTAGEHARTRPTTEALARVAATLWRPPDGADPDASSVEPDLLQTAAEILFSEPPGETADRRRAAALAASREALTFEQWRRWHPRRRPPAIAQAPGYQHSPPPPTGDPVAVTALRRMGLPEAWPWEAALPLIFWQAALWAVGAACDAAALAGEWAAYFRPLAPRGRYPKPPPQYVCRAPGADGRAWAAELEALAWVGMGEQGTAPSMRVAADEAWTVPLEARGILSPWLAWGPREPHGGAKFLRRYDANPAGVLRLLCAGDLSVRLLQALPPGDVLRGAYAAVAVHAADFIWSSYERWLRAASDPGADAAAVEPEGADQGVNGAEGGVAPPPQPHAYPGLDGPDVPARFAGALLHVRRQVTMAGEGRLAGVAPNSYMDLLPAAGPPHNAPPHDFLAVVVPEVLLGRWVWGSWQDAESPGKGPARWGPMLRRLFYTHYLRGTRSFQGLHFDPHARDASLLFRFIGRRERGEQDVLEPRWLFDAYGQNSGRHWNQHPRQFLLTPATFPVRAWVQPAWGRPDPDPLAAGHADKAASCLAIAAERVAAAARDNPAAPVLDAPMLEAWAADFKKRLADASLLDRLDPFLLLRLVELLAQGLVTEAADQGLVAQFVLEHGRPYVLGRLLQAVFPELPREEGVGNAGTGPVHPTAASTRLGLVRSMHRLLRIDDDEAAGYAGPCDPQERANDRLRRNTVRRTLFELARASRAPGGDQDLFEELRKLSADMTGEAAATPARVVHVPLTATTGTTPPAVGGRVTSAEYDPTRALAAACDRGTEQCSVVLEDLDDGVAEDLFLAQREYVEELLYEKFGQPKTLLAVVIESTPMPGGGYRIDFECGAPRELRVDDYPESIAAGTWVVIRVRCTWSPGSDRTVWRVVRDAVQPLRSRRTAMVQLVAEHEQDWAAWRLTLLESTFLRRGVDADPLWNADWSMALRGPDRPPLPAGQSRVLARWSTEAGRGRWVPVDRGSLDLLVRRVPAEPVAAPPGQQEQDRGATDDATASSSDACAIFVLTFIERTFVGSLVEEAYRFSASPGENYVIARSEFAARDADELDEALDARSDPRGLIVVLVARGGEAVDEFRRGVWTLWRDAANLATRPEAAQHLELAAPFDDRNLRWRGLLDNWTIIKTERPDGPDHREFITRLGVPGAPVRVPGLPEELEVRRANARDSVSFDAEYTVWQYARFKGTKGAAVPTAVIQATPVRSQGVEPRDGWKDFISRWSRIRRGDVVRLVRTIDTQISTTRGTIPCATDENVVVYVDAESLLGMDWLTKEVEPWKGERMARLSSVLNQKGEIVETAGPFTPSEVQGTPARRHGVLASVSAWTKAGLACEIRWDEDPEELLQPVTLTNTERLPQGSPVEAVLDPATSRWSLRVYRLYLRADALWRVSAAPAAGEAKPTQRVRWIGSTSAHGRRAAVVQASPGEAAVLERRPSPSTHLLEIIGGGEHPAAQGRPGGLTPDLRLDDLAAHGSFRTWTVNGREYRRAILAVGHHILPGICPAEARGANVRVLDVFVWLEHCCDDLYVLRREFDLESRSAAAAAAPRAATADGRVLPADRWHQVLRAYLDAKPKNGRGVPILARYDGTNVRLERVDWGEEDDADEAGGSPTRQEPQIRVRAEDPPGVTRWEDVVRVADGPWVSTAPYARGGVAGQFRQECVVAIVEETVDATAAAAAASPTADGQIVPVRVTFRGVPDVRLDEYRAAFQIPIGKSHHLREEPLYYVGPEYADPQTGEAYSEDRPRHRFEWACGRSLLVPERQLRINEQPFSAAQLLLFHGDYLKTIEFQWPESVRPVADSRTAAEAGDETAPADQEADEAAVRAADPDPREVVLCIRQAWLQLGDATRLYLQRRDFGMLHTLQVEASGGEARVVSVTGFDDRRLSDDQRRSFAPEACKLAPPSAGRLVSRLAVASGTVRADGGSAGAERTTAMARTTTATILGRLDMESFEQDAGRHIVYHHVRLTFEPGPWMEEETQNALAGRDGGTEGHTKLWDREDLPCVRDGETILMRAQEIRPLINDYGLALEPLDLSPEDVGADFPAQLLLLRRRFSTREDLLRRIYWDPALGPAHFARAEAVMLVNLSRQWVNGEQRVRASMTELRPRSAAALGDRAADDLVFATVARDFEARVADEAEAKPEQPLEAVLRLELKPGFFVELQPEWIAEVPPRLHEGDVVHVDVAPTPVAGGLAPRRLRITTAAYGDQRYVGKHGRPVIMLPMKPMLATAALPASPKVRRMDFWRDQRPFTVGGLPNLVPAPARYLPEPQTWAMRPHPPAFSALMTRPHPKIGWVARHWDPARQREEIVVEPFLHGCPAGHLELGADGLSVTYVRAHDDAAPPTPRPLEWHLLSFGDEPASALIARCRRERWRYHDDMTGHWVLPEAPAGTAPAHGGVEGAELGDHQVLWSSSLGRGRNPVRPGDVFFDEEPPGQLRLRYQQDRFLDYGLPVDALLESLQRQPGRAGVYPVAGVPRPEGGLWIELAPGRLVEVPPRRMVVLLRGRVISVANLDWAAFAPGDRVGLSLPPRRDPLEPQPVALTSWSPGARGALGPGRALLPLAKQDAKTGALALGDGQYVLTVPWTRAAPPSPEVVAVSANNMLAPWATTRAPARGDVVLLGLDRQTRRPIVRGLEQLDLRPVPDGDGALWDGDPLDWDAHHALPGLIDAVGGALPVTVEGMSRRDGILFFSRRHQTRCAGLARDLITCAQVVGFRADADDPDKGWALARYGRELTWVSMRQLVSGLPPALFRAAADALRVARVPVWLRGAADGRPWPGVVHGRLAEFFAEAVAVVAGPAPAPASESPTAPVGEDDVARGLICRADDTLALHYLPEQEASWAQLSHNDLAGLFINPAPRPGLQVRATGAGRYGSHVSATRVGRVQGEFDRLRLGSQVTARPCALALPAGEPMAPPSSGTHRRWLVRSLLSGVVMEYWASQAPPPDLGDLRAVVEHRRTSDGRRVVRVVPPNERRFRLDLPSDVIALLLASGPARRKWQSVPAAMADTPASAVLAAFDECYPENESDAAGGDGIGPSADAAVAITAGNVDGAGAPDPRPTTAAPDPASRWRMAVQRWSVHQLGPEFVAALGTRAGSAAVSPGSAAPQYRAQEVRASYGIRAVLLADALADTSDGRLARTFRRLARELLFDLGMRALRTVHVDLLKSQWLRDSQSMGQAFWDPVNKVILPRLTAAAAADGLDFDGLQAVRRFVLAVRLRFGDSPTPLGLVAHALLASVGEVAEPSLLTVRRPNSVTTALIALFRGLRPSAYPDLSLLQPQRQQIWDALRLVRQSYDVTLLDPLPNTWARRATGVS